MGIWGNPQPQVSSTQEILKFAEIHDGIIITKTGELRAILMVSSINFALKSEQEQTAIIFAYQNFLNSLEFPIQIMMQSKKLDLSNYLASLKKIGQVQTNELLRVQTLDYIDFVGRLINIANIMDKKFYVCISFAAPPKMSQSAAKNETPKITMQEFETYKQELVQRIQVIESGLGSIGIRCAQLGSQQIIELLYGIYNPEESSKEKLTQIDNLTSQVVESAVLNPEEAAKSGEAK
ncbi:TPA: hypothetical protein DD449_04240 [Candidatus Berkelbacteria bacterium]|uniref:TraC-like domain-containing protein n=1 Tax=Berkelbacteria bacterium GW2011_GWE1_39_12 TaxID=1618337 RepID=A0A0G4B4E9_9BACT|nr:MAG: hypothetical protein UT28_C0001G0468 [Berkelbacteria bacterium GW2011_GWE1_39_12]HBO60864.1 hypothetical protein [Candidatus Berkelbacteria bacterium]